MLLDILFACAILFSALRREFITGDAHKIVPHLWVSTLRRITGTATFSRETKHGKRREWDERRSTVHLLGADEVLCHTRGPSKPDARDRSSVLKAYLIDRVREHLLAGTSAG